MSASEWAPWATVSVGLLTAVTAVVLGGALTHRGRLERRLEKLVAICDKLPSGSVRTDMERLAEAMAAEILVRSNPRTRADGKFVSAGVVAGGIASFVMVYGVGTGAPALPGPYWWIAGGLVLGAVTGLWATGWQDKVRQKAAERLIAALAADAAADESPGDDGGVDQAPAQDMPPQDDPPVDQGQRLAS